MWRGGRKPSGKSGVGACSSADDDDAGFDGKLSHLVSPSPSITATKIDAIRERN